MSTVLVVGANGTVGSELSRLLATQGAKVLKATSRQPSAADQVQVNLVTQAGLKAAFNDITPDAMRQGLLSAGLPVDYAEFLILGYAERTTEAVKEVTGHPPRTIEQYAQDFGAHCI